MSAPDKESEDGTKWVDSTSVTCVPEPSDRAPTEVLTCHFRQLRVTRFRGKKTAPGSCTVAASEWTVTFHKVGARRWRGLWEPSGACAVARVHTLEHAAATKVWTYSRETVVGSSDRETCGAGGAEYTGTSYNTISDGAHVAFPAKDIGCARIVGISP